MHEIIYNLALIDTINFCKQHDIDCSGTYLNKQDKHGKYIYTLTKQEYHIPVVTVEFHKMSVPTHYIHTEEDIERAKKAFLNN